MSNFTIDTLNPPSGQGIPQRLSKSTLLVNIAVIGSYDYPSNYGSDWLGHMTTNVELELSMATQGNTILQYGNRTIIFIIAARSNTILQYGFTGQHNTSVTARLIENQKPEG